MKLFLHGFLLLASLASVTLAAGECENKHVAIQLGNCQSSPRDAWGAAANIGDQSREYCFIPSTVVNNTLLISPDVCRDATGFGGFQNCENAFPQLPQLPAGEVDELPKDPWWASINPPGIVSAVKGRFILPTFTVIDDFAFGVVDGSSKSRNFSTPLLGLGPASSLMNSLLDSKRILRNAWSLRYGELILGAFNRAATGTSPLKEFPLQSPSGTDKDEALGLRTCAMKVKLTKVNWDFADGSGSIFRFTDSEAITACIEPNDEKFRFPALWKDGIINGLQKKLRSPQQSPPQLASGSWIQEPGINYVAGQLPPLGDLQISMQKPGGGEEVTVSIPGKSMVRPLELIEDGERRQNTSVEQVMIFNEQVLYKTAILGRIFLEQVHLLVDYESNRFWIGSQALTSLNATSQAPRDIQCFDTIAPPSSDNNNPGLSGGEIAGIVVGSVVGAGLILAGLWWYMRKRRARRRGSDNGFVGNQPNGHGPRGEQPEIAQVTGGYDARDFE